ncbi:MAG TPA: FAD-binding oxidoreductase [Burkholderiaceae bacterium]|nr:FAD-binding oxidoreductase [Burkholderiaceae bacterium]
MLLQRLRDVAGASHVLTAHEDTAPYLTDWRQRFVGRAQAVVLPADVKQVAALISACAEQRVPIVPQGGNTGLVGGATPSESGDAIVLSLKRMNRVRDIDAVNGTITVEAGCVLHDVQQAANNARRLFPLSLAAEGTATIGGNLSTNAGGTQVLRYGNARELALGLEVVLPSGEIWNGLRGLRKDNTGYDLRDLFIGAEGTLGVITAACLKTFPLPRAQVTAVFALEAVAAALALLALAQTVTGPTLTAFEFFSDTCMQLVTRHFPDQRSPFESAHPQYVLLQLSDHEDEQHAAALLQALAERALDQQVISDAAIAQSTMQSRSLWKLRESITEAQVREGKNIKHDISVPISSIARFIDETDALLAQRFPGVRMVTFGHLGDGNLHYNVMPPAGMAEDLFFAQQPAIYQCVHDQVTRFSGSISAEHGIGQLKRDENARYKSAVEINLMREIKRALDPLNIMNPGKVV